MSNAPTPITPVRAGSRPRRTTAPANWAKWKLIPRCTLWNAACLTLDIEPNTDGAHDWLTRKRPPDGFPAEFSDRLGVLTANFDADVFRVVQIADVAAAAIGWGWSIPEAMKSLPTAPVLVGSPVRAESVGNGPVESAPVGARLATNKAALIAQHKHEWPTIARDIQDAAGNGLSKAAKAGTRDWHESDALEWARSKNKLMQTEKLVPLANVMRNLTGKKHVMGD